MTSQGPSALPPIDIQSEESLVGSLIIDGERIVEVAGFLRPEHFYRESNRWIYEACLALYQHNEPINQVTLAMALDQAGHLADVGGLAYLSTCAAQVPTSLHIESYARAIVRTATYRSIISVGGQIAGIGYAGGLDAQAVLSSVQVAVQSLDLPQQRGWRTLQEIMDEWAATTVLAPAGQYHGDGALWHTGFADLDTVLGGLHPKDLIVLAARPAMGKSALAFQIARHMAMEQGAHVAVFSLEMSGEQIAQRLISAESEINNTRIRLGHFNDTEEAAVMNAMGVLSESRIHVDDTSVLSVPDLRSRVLKLVQTEGRCDIVMVDYLQLLSAGKRVDNRTHEVTMISQGLKALARDLNIPVLAVAQLNRASEHRADHVPQLSDLREGGSIEQDADVVMLLHREEAYWSEQSWHSSHPLETYPSGIAQVIIAKHRNGPTGEVKLFFRKHLTRFENLAAHGQLL